MLPASVSRSSVRTGVVTPAEPLRGATAQVRGKAVAIPHLVQNYFAVLFCCRIAEYGRVGHRKRTRGACDDDCAHDGKRAKPDCDLPCQFVPCARAERNIPSRRVAAFQVVPPLRAVVSQAHACPAPRDASNVHDVKPTASPHTLRAPKPPAGPAVSPRQPFHFDACSPIAAVRPVLSTRLKSVRASSGSSCFQRSRNTAAFLSLSRGSPRKPLAQNDHRASSVVGFRMSFLQLSDRRRCQRHQKPYVPFRPHRRTSRTWVPGRQSPSLARKVLSNSLVATVRSL